MYRGRYHGCIKTGHPTEFCCVRHGCRAGLWVFVFSLVSSRCVVCTMEVTAMQGELEGMDITGVDHRLLMLVNGEMGLAWRQGSSMTPRDGGTCL